MKFDEIYVGDLERRMDVLDSTLDNQISRDIARRLDLPGQVPGGYQLQPHVHGSELGDVYLFARVGPDNHTGRGGMVFGHALVVPKTELVGIEDIGNIYEFLVSERPEEIRACARDIDTSAIVRENLPGRLRDIVTDNQRGPAVTADPSQLEHWATTVWPRLFGEMRTKLRFGLQFAPEDSEHANKHFALVPKKNLALWPRNDRFEANSEDALAKTPAGRGLSVELCDAIYQLGAELGVSHGGFEEFAKLARAHDFLKSEPRGFDTALAALRALAALQPDPHTGTGIKNSLLKTIIELPGPTSAKALLQLRNVAFESVSDNTLALRTQLERAAESILSAKQSRDDMASILATVSTDGSAGPIWTGAVKRILRGKSASICKNIIDGLEVLIDQKPLTAVRALGIIDSIKLDKDLAEVLRTNKTEAEPKISNALVQNGFSVSEAEVLIISQGGDARSALKIASERDQDVYGSTAVSLSLERMKAAERLSAAFDLDNNLVHEAAVSAIVAEPLLLGAHDLTSSIAEKLWHWALQKSDQSWAIADSRDAVQDRILDEIVPKSCCDELLNVLMHGPAGNWHNHNRAEQAFNILPVQALELALDQTASAWLMDYPEYTVDAKELAPDSRLGAVIASQTNSANFIDVLMANELPVALAAFNGNPAIPQIRFRSYLDRLIEDGIQFKRAEAEMVGRLLVVRQWRECTRGLADRYGKNHGLIPTYEVAAEHLGRWTAFRLGIREPSKSDLRELLTETASELYYWGANDREIWERAGGQVSKIDTSGSGETQWRKAITHIGHGGVGCSIQSLIRAMMEDYPDNEKLNYLQRTL